MVLLAAGTFREVTMADAYEIIDHSYDVVIVGAGGAGMRAALGMAASGLKTTRAQPSERSPASRSRPTAVLPGAVTRR